MDQAIRFPLGDLVEIRMTVQKTNDGPVDDYQGGRSDESASERIIWPNDRVLNRIRKQEQHHEIKRVELSELALAGESQTNEKKKLNDDRAEDFLRNRHRRQK